MSDPSPSDTNARPAIQVNMLEYEHVDAAAVEKQRKRKQFMTGMAAPYALALPAIVVANAVQDVPAWLAVSYAIVLIAITLCVQVWSDWKAFLPGVLTGVFVVPLIFAFLCAIAVGIFR